MVVTAGLTRCSTVRVTVRSLSNGGVAGGATATGGRDRPKVSAPTGPTRTVMSFLSSRCSRLGRNFLVGCFVMGGPWLRSQPLNSLSITGDHRYRGDVR